MDVEPKALDALVESVADGNGLDWPTLEAAAVDDADHRLLFHLSIVAGVAEGNGLLSHDNDDEPNFSGELPSLAEPVRRWGHLLLLEKIGEGRYADVYRGRDVGPDTDVAVKLLKPREAEEILACRLLAEAGALARSRHENVVSVRGAGIHEGHAGLWMDLVPGRTLDELLLRQGPLGASDAARIGGQLCAALTAVHESGVVHGDIKAENVMQEPGGRVVLLDFGAAQLACGPLRDAAPAGTPLYLAPEVLIGGGTTISSDVYAMGVLLYRMVTDTYPVMASSLDGLTTAHMNGEHRALRTARPDLPAGFVAVVNRALDQRPSRRFPSSQAMEEALRLVDTSQPCGP